jgi:hypothetical protein
VGGGGIGVFVGGLGVGVAVDEVAVKIRTLIADIVKREQMEIELPSSPDAEFVERMKRLIARPYGVAGRWNGQDASVICQRRGGSIVSVDALRVGV